MHVRRISREPIGTSFQLQVTQSLHLTLYSIRRDHSVRCGVFQVSVPEAGQRGVGLQLRTWTVGKGWQLFGASIVHEVHVT